MRKRLISMFIVAFLIFGIYGYAKTTEETSSEEETNIEDAETAMYAEEYGSSVEETASSELAGSQGETDVESLDILREMEKYKSRFIELYSSNALSDEFPDVEPEMIIEEHDFPSDSSESASLTVYSALSGKRWRYEIHYYGETGNSVINYYLCNDFVWISRQNNYYSSLTLSAEYSDVLYSTIENWIITDDATYIMHDNRNLEQIDKAQLESEIPMA